MTLKEAIKKVEAMPEKEFRVWFKSLPYRTQLLVGGGMVDWREVLGDWFQRQFNSNQKGGVR